MFCIFHHILRFFSQKQRWAKESDIEQYLQTWFVILTSSSWNTQLKAHGGMSSPWYVVFYVNTIIWNAVCKQQRWLFHSELSHKELKSFYSGGVLLYKAALGLVSITQWWMGIPCQGHVALQCLLSSSTSSSLDTDGWSIWLSSNRNCDFSLLRTLPFDMFALRLKRDQNGAQKNSPQIVRLADYWVLAPHKIIKWSPSKENKKRERGK